jgi:hypothetical protein
VPGGFRLLNFAYYRGIFNAEDRREQNRLAQVRYRQKLKTITVSKRNKKSASVITNKPSEAEAETETETNKETRVLVSACADKEPETRLPVSNWLTSDDVWIDLQQILPPQEIQNHIGLWISRIKENRGALYEAVCDFKDKRNQSEIRNVAAWLTQRYQHFKDLSAQHIAHEETEKLRAKLRFSA